MRSWPGLRHLAARFIGSLSRTEPSPAQLEWLESKLNAGERGQLGAMSVADRRHAVACAREAEELFGAEATDELIVAAALHDVGKTDADLGTPGRVVATVLGTVISPERLERWSRGAGRRRAVAAYLDHDVRGAELLGSLGSAPMVVAWAREHHLDEARWSIPVGLGRRLAEADLVSSNQI